MTGLQSRRMAIVLSIGAIAAAGCGSSSSTKTATPAQGPGTTTPAGGFVAQVNSLCQQGNAAVRAVPTVSSKVAVIASYIKKFEALTPPASQKATYASFIANLKAEVAAANARDGATLRKANAQTKVDGARLGAPHCAGM